MSASTIVVALNALLLRRVDLRPASDVAVAADDPAPAVAVRARGRRGKPNAV